jgi:ribulose-bisphosphate carboxylase large chain
VLLQGIKEPRMLSQDMKSFFSHGQVLNMDDYIVLTYRFESVNDPEEAAAHLCQEQSTAQWKRPGKEEDFRGKHGAKVLDLRVEGQVPTARFSELRLRNQLSTVCTVRIAHPHANFGPRIPNLLSAACGEGAFFSPGIAAIKLMDIDLPEGFLSNFAGPQFGIEGFREILQVYDRPILFGVAKPNLGLAPADFAAIAAESWR